VLVARDQARMELLATRLRAEAQVAVDVLPADLTQQADLAKVERACAKTPPSASWSTTRAWGNPAPSSSKAPTASTAW
jgi:hypothetical protein